MSLFKRLGIIPIAIVLAVVVGAAAGVMVLSTLGGQGGQAEEGKEKPAATKTPVKTEEAHGAMVKLKERVVNLADPGGRRYLKIGITLELEPKDPKAFAKLEGEARRKEEEKIEKGLEDASPVINDILTTVLSAKSYDQISPPDGKEKLKEELKKQLEKALPKEKILKLYFTEFVVQ